MTYKFNIVCMAKKKKKFQLKNGEHNPKLVS